MRASGQKLCGILCLISSLPVLYFDMLYTVAASYSGGLDDPLIALIAFSMMGYPAVAVIVTVVATLNFQRTNRFTWRTFLVPVLYLAAIVALIALSGGAYLYPTSKA